MGALLSWPVLFIDAQATGASPTHGHLMELAWCRGLASEPEPDHEGLEGSLVALPARARVPGPVSRLTGLRTADLAGAPPASAVWDGLLGAAWRLREETGRAPVAVIHFARYERAFLSDLQARFGPAGDAPLELVCTHEIARRLLPELPRRGIRALSGYLGYPVPELKRAGHHVLTTAAIWSELVGLLAEDAGVETLDGLLGWLESTEVPRRRGKPGWPLEREVRLGLPSTPGVYRMLSRRQRVLYVGKASDLKRRVNSYFQKRRGHAERTMELLTCAHALQITETGSALEAALLESDEIKRHDPLYNVALKAEERALGWACPRTLRPGAPPLPELLGPLPAPDALAPARVLLEALEAGRLPSGGARAVLLEVPEEHLPDDACLRAGLELFCQRSGLGSGATPEALWALGRVRYAQWMAAREEARLARSGGGDEDEASEERDEGAGDGAGDDGAAAGAGGEAWTWSPEAVAFALDARVTRCAHLIRRGAWLVRLAESALVWSPRHLPPDARRGLVVAGGQVVWQGALEPDAPFLAPPGLGRSPEARQGDFDVVTYDRLRVLTTELRRVAGEGRGVALQTGTRGAMGACAVASCLRWL